MSPQILTQCVQSELARIRFASKGDVKITNIIAWDRANGARGTYSHFAPRQSSRFQGKMAQPWQRIHLTGKRTAIASLGIESARISVERVANEVLARIKYI